MISMAAYERGGHALILALHQTNSFIGVKGSPKMIVYSKYVGFEEYSRFLTLRDYLTP